MYCNKIRTKKKDDREKTAAVISLRRRQNHMEKFWIYGLNLSSLSPDGAWALPLLRLQNLKYPRISYQETYMDHCTWLTDNTIGNTARNNTPRASSIFIWLYSFHITCFVWGLTYKTCLTPILQLQKCALRIITFFSVHHPNSILFIDLRILSFTDLRNL